MAEKKYFLGRLFILIYLIIVHPCVFAGSKEERLPNGKIYKTYGVDLENRKSGSYTEFYENGNIKITASYSQNLLVGLYQEFSDGSQKVLEGNYVKGKKHGEFKYFQNGKLINKEIWIDDILAFPRSMEEVSQTLKNISKLKVEYEGEWPANFNILKFTKEVENDNLSALAKVREYRYLCNFPYKDLQLNKEYIAHNLNGVKILSKLNQLSRNPKNPGLSEDEFKSGSLCLSTSYLLYLPSGGSGAGMVDNYFAPINNYFNNVGNIQGNFLLPNLKNIGFASEGYYSVAWVFPKGYNKNSSYDFNCFPAKGYMPVSHFSSSNAWYIYFNLNKYKKIDLKAIDVRIYLVKDNKKVEKKLISKSIEDFEYKGSGNCLMFSPFNISCEVKDRYLIIVEGVKDLTGEEAKIEYFVEFF